MILNTFKKIKRYILRKVNIYVFKPWHKTTGSALRVPRKLVKATFYLEKQSKITVLPKAPC